MKKIIFKNEYTLKIYFSFFFIQPRNIDHDYKKKIKATKIYFYVLHIFKNHNFVIEKRSKKKDKNVTF